MSNVISTDYCTIGDVLAKIEREWGGKFMVGQWKMLPEGKLEEIDLEKWIDQYDPRWEVMDCVKGEAIVDKHYGWKR